MRKAKVGLALGSGAFRGFSHIGVITALIENNINIDYIAGSSIGAVIGALYCAGVDMNYTAKILEHIRLKDLIDFAITRKGLIKGDRIIGLLNVFLKSKNFKDLIIPFSIVTTDIKTGEKCIFSDGKLLDAIRASISIPGIFTPVNIGGKMLVDGGVAERLPSHTVKNMGADIVIGVDVGYKVGDYYEPRTLFDVIMQSIGIIEAKNITSSFQICDVLITPDMNYQNPYSFDNIDKIILAGKNATLDKINEIRNIIDEFEKDYIKSRAVNR